MSHNRSACRQAHYKGHPARYNPSVVDPGYSGTTCGINCDTLFTAHPLRMVSADLLDQKHKHLRLNQACGDMFISYNKPSGPTCKKVKCPPKVSFPYPKNRPDLLTCWRC